MYISITILKYLSTLKCRFLIQIVQMLTKHMLVTVKANHNRQNQNDIIFIFHGGIAHYSKSGPGNIASHLNQDP